MADDLTTGEELRAAFLRHVCQTSPEPLAITVNRAAAATVWDTRGRAYLDLLSGIGVANVGHAHPEVVRAVQEQAARYLHVMVYGEAIIAPQVALAQRLAEVTPGDLEVTYFTNSGTEAVEGALKTARKFTGRANLAAFDGSFHGDTFGSLSVGGNPIYRQPFEPLLPGVRLLPFDDLEGLRRIDESVAAVIVEPIQGEGGVRVPQEAFLPALRHRCTEVGALLIFDEVITGFGRTGALFACTHWGVTPDLLVLAKALGGGMPLGAFIGRREVMATLSHDPPLAHVTTFGGHPLSCAAGLAALSVLLREQLPARAADLGEYWRARLAAHAGGVLRAVRGRGLLLGLEFRNAGATQRFARACFHRGLIVNWTLHRDSVIRLAPPLIITEEECERALSLLEEALGETATS
ncbi:MAG: aspartate aminotransferase family protein [Deltaproteobacteria bacterium]|nr:aspartate aminotransferase family protein [Deltaproteobacteria bacterium]